MATVRATSWAEAFIPGIYNFMELGFNVRPPLYPQLYDVRGSVFSKEEFVNVGALPTDQWDTYEEGNAGEHGTANFEKGYTTTLTPKEHPIDFSVERKAADDDQYGVLLANRAERIGISAAHYIEGVAAGPFNNATSDTGPDAVSLGNNSHPQNPAATGTTQDNYFTVSLSQTNLSTVRTSMVKFTDDQNNTLAITPDTILVPPDLEDTALRVAHSQLLPGTGDNDLNPQNGRFNVVVWNRLTDTNRWFLIDSVQMRQSLKFIWRKPLEITLKSQTATLITYTAYMRFISGYTDWRWVAVCEPS
jgi:hypothetical protein